MDLLSVFQSLADVGITVPTLIGLKILYQINKQFVNHDKRISVLEAINKHRRKDD